jgi:hypothetical protein
MSLDMSRADWRKSSYSSTNGECVEVATWRKASYSGTNGECVEVADWRKASFSAGNGACVEAGTADRAVAVRDSQDPTGPSLAFEPSAWRAFAASLKAGDLLV